MKKDVFNFSQELADCKEMLRQLGGSIDFIAIGFDWRTLELSCKKDGKKISMCVQKVHMDEAGSIVLSCLDLARSPFELVASSKTMNALDLGFVTASIRHARRFMPFMS